MEQSYSWEKQADENLQELNDFFQLWHLTYLLGKYSFIRLRCVIASVFLALVSPLSFISVYCLPQCAIIQLVSNLNLRDLPCGLLSGVRKATHDGVRGKEGKAVSHKHLNYHAGNAVRARTNN